MKLASPLLALLAIGACSKPADLVVYCSLDQVHSEPIIALFETETGLHVEAHFDVERNKTVGLVNRIFAERKHPYADVFWNNETAHTIRLKRAGLTSAYSSEQTQGIPKEFRDPEHHWTGFAARARVILHQSETQEFPTLVHEIGQSPVNSVGAMAAPLTGTTLTHFAVWSTLFGRKAVLTWLKTARDSGLGITSGNANAMRRVCEKDFPWCLTDTDDAAAAQDNGFDVSVHYPGQSKEFPAVLVIPNTVCILNGAPHRAAAERFIDFVTSASIESRLAKSRSQQIPLRPGVEVPFGRPRPHVDFAMLTIDWEAVATELEALSPEFKKLFLR